MPSQALLAIMMRMTQAPSGESPPMSIEQPRVPASWRPSDIERIQTLVAMFDLPPRTGAIDAVEFLLNIGLHHSPLGWPSLDILQDVRAALENEVPAGCNWPDFFVTEDVLAKLPLFADPNDAEADLASKFPPQTSKQAAPFDRSAEQLRWLRKVFRSFVAPIRQQQAYDLEINWWDHQMRLKDEDKVCTKLLDDIP